MYLDRCGTTDPLKVYKSAAGTHLGPTMNCELIVSNGVLL